MGNQICTNPKSSEDNLPPLQSSTPINSKQLRSGNVQKKLSFKEYKQFKFIDKIKEHYKFSKELGHGSFGSVFLAVDLITNVEVAIKVISKQKLGENQVYMDLMYDELSILQKTDHPHVTRVFEVIEDKKNFYVVMELIKGGDLMGKVVKMHHFSEDHAVRIVHQIILALNYMHNLKITHRDLKPDNLMCNGDDDNLIIKLTDFGFACFFDPKKKMDVILGTPIYMAPELVEGKSYDARVDVWSLGCIVYILLCGKPPFDGKDTDEIKQQILKKNVEFNQENQQNISQQARDFVLFCLNRNPNERPFVQQLFEHSWIKKWIQDPVIKAETKLAISETLRSFSKANLLQSSVLSIMSNLLTTSEEMKEYIQLFNSLDTTHDGFISIDEMREGLKRTGFLGATTDDDWDKILDSMDQDGNGQIDFNEFITATYDRKKLLSKENIKIAFNMFDRDGSGTITKQELKALFGNCQGLDVQLENMWSQIMSEVHTNTGDEITQDEFCDCMEKILAMTIPKSNQNDE